MKKILKKVMGANANIRWVCYCNNIEIINFLKIDCEGSDLDILKGAKFIEQ